MLAVVATVTDAATGQPREVVCLNRGCGRHLGWVYHGRTLVEPVHGQPGRQNTSALPCRRICPRCGRTHRLLPR